MLDNLGAALKATKGAKDLPPTNVFYDNLGAKYTSETRESRRCKHISLRHSFVREMVEGGETALRYVSTTRNVSDLHTKALPEKRFVELCKLKDKMKLSDYLVKK